MESNSWRFRFSDSSRSSSSSRRYQHRPDLFLGGGYEEFDGDEDFEEGFLCPFCAEDFDIVGLYCHIDEEHPLEVKNGVCPVCVKKVGMDIVSHITMQHGNFLKVQKRRRLRNGGSNLTFSMLKKELREGNLHARLGGSSCIVSPSNVEADPLLSSFMFNPPTTDEPVSFQSLSIAETSAEKESPDKGSLERKPQQSELSETEHEEKAQRCEFVRGLLISTILDESL